MDLIRLVEGQVYLYKGREVVYSRPGREGRVIVHPPGEPDMQSSMSVTPAELSDPRDPTRASLAAGPVTFEVVASGRDEYPGDGLYLKAPGHVGTAFLEACGLHGVRAGDEIEFTIRIVSRVVPARREKVG